MIIDSKVWTLTIVIVSKSANIIFAGERILSYYVNQKLLTHFSSTSNNKTQTNLYIFFMNNINCRQGRREVSTVTQNCHFQHKWSFFLPSHHVLGLVNLNRQINQVLSSSQTIYFISTFTISGEELYISS